MKSFLFSIGFLTFGYRNIRNFNIYSQGRPVFLKDVHQAEKILMAAKGLTDKDTTLKE